MLSDKSVAGSGVNMHGNESAFNNEKLAEELNKPIIRKFKKRTVYSRFKDNIWCGDLADMQLRSKCDKVLWYFLRIIDIFTNYAWVAPLKDKKGILITNAFQKILGESNRKQNKIWVNKAGEFYHNPF